ncbi:MAG: small multi-drug export protein [Thermoplasmatales archaeon]|nr:small multi-drug export protein [Thermoplasmatales archaeon]
MKIFDAINEIYKQIQKTRHSLSHLYKVLIFITPFLTIAFYFVFVFDYLPSEIDAKYAGLVVAYLFPPLGKESIIPLMLFSDIPAWITGSTIIIMDIISSAIIAYNWWFAELIIYHIPYLDKGYDKLKKKSENFSKRKLVTVAMIIFMAVPFQGTGGISTTILSRLLGFKAKKTVAIVALGSSITTSLMIMAYLGLFNFIY